MKELNRIVQPFYIRQKVVAISDGMVSGRKKDQIYIVKNIRKMQCGCWLIDVGFIDSSIGFMICTKCNIDDRSNISNVYWQSISEYRAIEEKGFPLIKLTKILEKELVSAN